jgi:hypothetical protein
MILVPLLNAAQMTHSNTSHKHTRDQQRMSDNMAIVYPHLYSIYAETDSKYFISLLNVTAGEVKHPEEGRLHCLQCGISWLVCLAFTKPVTCIKLTISLLSSGECDGISRNRDPT